METVKQPAIKKKTGKVITKELPAHHKDLVLKDKKSGGDGKGQRGFVLSSGSFVSRQDAKKVSKKSGQTNPKGKRGMHSSDIPGNTKY